MTSCFHFGLAESAGANPLSEAGIPTTVMLRANRPLAVNYIMGIAPLPRRFDRVKRIDFRGDHIRLTPFSGTVIEHPVDLSFI